MRFIGIDPGSEHGGCPSVWVDGNDGSFVIQDWEVGVTWSPTWSVTWCPE
ncbi:hypothetical protein [Streptosporangium sp. CA-115845]